MSTNRINTNKGEKIFRIFNSIFMFVMMFVMTYPLWHVLMSSFSDAVMLSSFRGLLVRPVGFSFDAYKLMAKNPMILRGYINTLTILAFGLMLNMILTIIGAYFMSRKNVLLNKTITLMIIFTMYFSGGLIPFYITVKELGMENSLLALFVPTAINTFNLIIMRTSFTGIPSSMEESAKLDGAGHLTILFRIVVPLSKATISVIALYYSVAHWNAWFHAMIFLTDRRLFPLQLILQEILIQNDTSSMTQMVNIGDSAFIGETVKYAVVVISVLPIICVYPFVQKYFVKGVMIGAVKG